MITMLMQHLLKVVDQNPLGSAAGYGSSFPIDRTFTTKELGFETLNTMRLQPNEPWKIRKNSGFCHEQCCHLSQILMDVCLYMSQILISSLYQRILQVPALCHKKTRMF
jgi:argininosuccinate lyase